MNDPHDHTDRAHATALLTRAAEGDGTAADQFTALLYDHLRQLAAGLLRAESPSHTLQPTALVNEAYLRLVDQRSVDATDRAAFFALAATLMRRILVDHARARTRLKRGGTARRVDISPELLAGPDTAPDHDIEAVDVALRELAELDERKARLLELRFFAGLDEAVAAEVLGISRATASREWRFARVWLAARLGSRPEADADPGDGN